MNSCKNCMHFTEHFYRKGGLDYKSIGSGFCGKHEHTQISTESCESYEYDEEFMKTTNLEIKRVLYDIHFLVNIIKQRMR